MLDYNPSGVRIKNTVGYFSNRPRLEEVVYLEGKRKRICGKACPLVAVESRLMVRPWTYVCRRIEEVVYLEGKRKRT